MGSLGNGTTLRFIPYLSLNFAALVFELPEDMFFMLHQEHTYPGLGIFLGPSFRKIVSRIPVLRFSRIRSPGHAGLHVGSESHFRIPLESLIRVSDKMKRSDEWINTSSDRLAPFGTHTARAPPFQVCYSLGIQHGTAKKSLF